MTLARQPFLLPAREEGWAVGAFSAYNLEQILAIRQAAEHESAPVILQAGSSAFSFAGLGPLASLALTSAEDSTAEIGVHLDHSYEVEEVRTCIELGYSSVMIDGSALSFDDNVALTKRVVRPAHAAGVWVEGELATISGREDVSTSAVSGKLTDPEAAARFVELTGVDALAVAVGNVHGIPDHPVSLNLNRLAEISERVAIPLVLHGASGLPEQEIRAAISLGVAKLNVNTELRRAYRSALSEAVRRLDLTDELRPTLEILVDGVCDVVRKRIRLFSEGAPSKPKESPA